MFEILVDGSIQVVDDLFFEIFVDFFGEQFLEKVFLALLRNVQHNQPRKPSKTLGRTFFDSFDEM
jgi:hypothetical protein